LLESLSDALRQLYFPKISGGCAQAPDPDSTITIHGWTDTGDYAFGYWENFNFIMCFLRIKVRLYILVYGIHERK